MQFVKEAKEKERNRTKDEKEEILPSDIIKGRDWFKWEWKYDPTILSMLVMIDSIYNEMGNDWEQNPEPYRKNLENITFNLLNLGDFGLSNELFIKMNARGKQLSEFDKLKSTLEEELQIQQSEKNEAGKPLASEEDEERWRTLMDGIWNDLFWHKYARGTIEHSDAIPIEERKNVCLAAAKLSEHQFRKLLLRLIALQLFEYENLPEKLAEAAYNLEDAKIDNLLFEYIDSLIELRSDENHETVPDGTPTINFKRLMDDINLLIYKDSNDICYEISYLLPEISHIEKDERSVFDSFLEMKVPNDVELTFYSMLLFLRAFHPRKEEWRFDKTAHSAWLGNLDDWVRSTRNILLNDNNNQRIDKIQYSREATFSIQQMAADLVSFVKKKRLDVETDDKIVKKFLKSLNKTYQRLDNQSLAEEKLKAALVLDNSEDWEKYLAKAEEHPYLWGQIRCILNWSGNDLNSFKDYSDKLLQLLNTIRDDNQTYYTAMLAFSPSCWEDNNRLFQYNKDRDNSFKRYLREHTKEDQAYGIHIKALLDCWIDSYAGMSAKEFLTALTTSLKDSSAPWIQCIIKNPAILDEAWNKRIFNQNGHVILAQRKTKDSHCFDPVLVYLRNMCRNQKMDEKDYRLYDSKGELEHAFQLEKNGHTYLVEWAGKDGNYSIKVNQREERIVLPHEMICFMEEIISQ